MIAFAGAMPHEGVQDQGLPPGAVRVNSDRRSAKDLEAFERRSELLEVGVIDMEAKREAPAASDHHGRDGQIAVAQTLGPQVSTPSTRPEASELLGPTAQIVAEADQEEPDPVDHEAMLAERV